MPKITQQQKEAIRMEILNSARHVFIEKGYEATSMSDIVTSSSRSFGGVYLYYSGKEDVFLDLLRREYENMAPDFGLEEQGSAWNAFVQFIRGQEKRVREANAGLAPCLYEYFIVGRREDHRRKLIEERSQAVYGTLFDLIHNGVQRGEFHPAQPLDIFVHWLISLLEGLYIESIINGFENIQLAQQFELLLTVCRSILRPSGLEGNL
ncbi:TetR family transcriptional regulator [Fontibacillus phaseoli]|uniref:TetR family transcriptional regulator n=1 Tax=Fontibacillus phaseoli TaxID=1416533 RepID=A0A369BDB1_9BACL|nr:TetR family transcriptional regulator [Fontibacillus phaseoli]RCX18576.1 TetR family transcriptional regulator [Fontibacillus phaseoli]